MAAGSYLDTSVLFKLFLHEPGSERVMLWVAAQPEPLWVSELSDLEVTTTFLRDELQTGGQACAGSVSPGVSGGKLQRLAVDSRVFSTAVSIADRHAAEFRLRSLDVLHLATALRYGVPGMATFDNRLRTASRSAGLNVIF